MSTHVEGPRGILALPNEVGDGLMLTLSQSNLRFLSFF